MHRKEIVECLQAALIAGQKGIVSLLLEGNPL
jgi:hypothetical protein